MSLFEQVKEAAEGRWVEIILALTPIRAEHLQKGPTDWPCSRCGGESTFYVDNRDGGFSQHGRVSCRNCTDGRPTGDGIDSAQKFGGYSNQRNAALAIADNRGLEIGDDSAPSQPIDIIEAVARAKRMPMDAFRRFGVRADERGTERVARVDVYNECGEVHSHFDLSPRGKGKFRSGAGSSGVFLPGRKPEPGETWLMCEGVKDAAALTRLGYLACGLPTSYLAAKYARLFRGVRVVIVPDLDAAGTQGAERSASNLYLIAASIRIARLPGEFRNKGGDDVRDCLAKHGEQAVREAIESAKEWKSSERSDTGSVADIESIQLRLSDGRTMQFQIGESQIIDARTQHDAARAATEQDNAVACDQCGASMNPAPMLIGGWRNYDCVCGQVRPVHENSVA